MASYRLDHLFVVVQKIGDGLQERLQRNALLQQLPVGETDLGLRSSRHFSVLLFFRRLVSFSLQSFDIAWCGLEEQFLQCPPVVQTTAHLGDQFFRNVHGKTAPLQPPIEDVAGVLLSGLTSAAVFANARASAQAKRAQYGWTLVKRFALKPRHTIGRSVGFDTR